MGGGLDFADTDRFLRVLFGFVPILIFALSRRALSWSHLRHGHHFMVMALQATVIYYAFAKGAAGLTHGGFYRHFDSREALAQEACGRAFEQSAQH